MPLPPGFRYVPDVITAPEERDLLAELSSLEFASVEFRGYLAKRRAVHFGVDYRFDDRSLTPAAEIPPFLKPLRARVAAHAGLPADSFTEALIMEYPAGAVIGWHRDAPKFGDTVLGVSLLSTARMRFKRTLKETGATERAAQVLEPRSAYVLAGPARSEWYHSIPAVTSLRYSITFRTVI